jgi:hypothetical protein
VLRSGVPETFGPIGSWVPPSPTNPLHRGEADAAAQVLGIGRDGEERLGRRLEKEIIDHRLVLIGGA